MILNKYIEQNYEQLKGLAYSISRRSPLYEDLLHDTIIQLYKHEGFSTPEDATYYAIRTMYLSINSPSSAFYRKELAYSKNRSDISIEGIRSVEPYVADKLVSENLDQLIKRLAPFQRMVFEEYIFEGFSYQRLSDATGIPKGYLVKTVESVKLKLRKYVNHS